MAKKKKLHRPRPTIAEQKRLRRALSEARQTIRHMECYNWHADLEIRAKDNEFKALIQRSIEDNYRCRTAIANFNHAKARQWWKGPIKSRIDGAIYLHPGAFADHLTISNCIAEEPWFSDACVPEEQTVIIPEAVTHG